MLTTRHVEHCTQHSINLKGKSCEQGVHRKFSCLDALEAATGVKRVMQYFKRQSAGITYYASLDMLACCLHTMPELGTIYKPDVRGVALLAVAICGLFNLAQAAFMGLQARVN
eukprot:scaffold542275_cov55-Prasinocladus_malaysianus.AAC.1